MPPQDYTCTVNPWNAGSFTLKPGETRGFSTSPQGVTVVDPGPAFCPIGTSNRWDYTMDAVDSAGDVVSPAPALATVIVTLAF